MFIHMPTFKKAIKQAFSAGKLIVGNIDEQLYIECGNVQFWLLYNNVPNKIKGAIMEFTGELPEENDVFQAGIEGNQYKLTIEDRWSLQKCLKQANKRYVQTPVVFHDTKYSAFRFFQQSGNAQNVKVINEMLLSLINPAELDYEHGEGEISGPYSSEDGNVFYWKTDLCVLGICASKLYRGISRMVLTTMASVDFEGDYSDLEDKH